jgi:hypothetical protein
MTQRSRRMRKKKKEKMKKKVRVVTSWSEDTLLKIPSDEEFKSKPLQTKL